jgi:hypothetical protein
MDILKKIPDGVIDIFRLNLCQKYFLEGKGGRCEGWQLTTFLKSGSLNLLEP